MESITSSQQLKEAIAALEKKQELEAEAIKTQFHTVTEAFRPINLAKDAFHDFTTSTHFKGNLLDAAIGITTGIISKKVLVGGSSNPLIRILGTVLELGIASVVTKNPEGIKSAGMTLFNKIFKKKKEEKEPE